MPRIRTLGCLVVAASLCWLAAAHAAPDYTGKTLRLIVGTSPGGGYDTYARAIARHMPKHLPGKPNLIVQNMPGAGSLIAANYLYNVAKPDGLTFAMLISGLVMEQTMGTEGIKFDAGKFQWIGAPSVGMPACAFMGFSGVKTLDDVVKSKKTLTMGAAGSSTREQPRILKQLIGANVKLVPGYQGTAGVRAAMTRREVDGACWQWVSMKITARDMLNAKGDDRLIPVLLQGDSSDPQVKGLPKYTDFIKGAEDLEAFNAWMAQYRFFRPFAAPPKAPAEAVEALRKAFKATLEDPEFLALAKKTRMTINHVSAEDVAAQVKQVLAASPAVKAKLRDIIGN